MNDFKHFGMKRRLVPECNYNAIWSNLKTIRLGEGVAKELLPDNAEFYDVSLGNKCTTSCFHIVIENGKEVIKIGKSGCPFCYVSSDPNGKYYEDICDTWKKWMAMKYEVKTDNGITVTNKPFQIAIGSEGEPTEHPDFCEFIKTVYETGVVPNYTTNGVILSFWDKLGSEYFKKAQNILDATRKYVGGVAVSFGNKSLRPFAEKAIEGLIQRGECKINIHHIISTKESVDEFVEAWLKYGDNIAYHVLLPLMPSGRSKKGMEPGVFEYLEEQIQKNNIDNIAFGAHFVDYLKESKIKTWLYPPESLSKNVILEKDCVKITPSSFNLEPVQIINLS